MRNANSCVVDLRLSQCCLERHSIMYRVMITTAEKVARASTYRAPHGRQTCSCQPLFPQNESGNELVGEEWTDFADPFEQQSWMIQSNHLFSDAQPEFLTRSVSLTTRCDPEAPSLWVRACPKLLSPMFQPRGTPPGWQKSTGDLAPPRK
jgi:hypothetical protein